MHFCHYIVFHLRYFFVVLSSTLTCFTYRCAHVFITVIYGRGIFGEATASYAGLIMALLCTINFRHHQVHFTVFYDKLLNVYDGAVECETTGPPTACSCYGNNLNSFLHLWATAACVE